jgi:putative transposase
MPLRKIPFVNGQVYHIFNRSVDLKSVFIDKRDCERVIRLLDFYQVGSPPIRYSKFVKATGELKKYFAESLEKMQKVVDLICFCLMPNHFHLLLRQKEDEGIFRFVRNFQIGYSKYFNEKRKRSGALFQGQFKAVRIENDEQLVHVSRYIHLNPYSSYVVKDLSDLEEYPWSSYPEYVSDIEGICQKELVFSLIKTKEEYRKFVLDNADYQRKLEAIKHLILE